MPACIKKIKAHAVCRAKKKIKGGGGRGTNTKYDGESVGRQDATARAFGSVERNSSYTAREGRKTRHILAG